MRHASFQVTSFCVNGFLIHLTHTAEAVVASQRQLLCSGWLVKDEFTYSKICWSHERAPRLQTFKCSMVNTFLIRAAL